MSEQRVYRETLEKIRDLVSLSLRESSPSEPASQSRFTSRRYPGEAFHFEVSMTSPDPLESPLYRACVFVCLESAGVSYERLGEATGASESEALVNLVVNVARKLFLR